MKKNELHQLIRQKIPQISYLETDSPEAAEGECPLWEVDDCTIMLDFANPNSDVQTIAAALEVVVEKLAFINQNKDLVLQQLLPEHADLSTENVRGVYVGFWIENATDVFCDFAIGSVDWESCVAEFSLEEDNQLIFNGLDGV